MVVEIMVLTVCVFVGGISFYQLLKLRDSAELVKFANRYFSKHADKDLSLSVTAHGRLRRKNFPVTAARSANETEAKKAVADYINKLKLVKDVVKDVTHAFWGLVTRLYFLYVLLLLISISVMLAALAVLIGNADLETAIRLPIENLSRVLISLFASESMSALSWSGGRWIEIAATIQKSAFTFSVTGAIFLLYARATKNLLFTDEIDEIDREIEAYSSGGLQRLRDLRREEGRSYSFEDV